MNPEPALALTYEQRRYARRKQNPDYVAKQRARYHARRQDPAAREKARAQSLANYHRRIKEDPAARQRHRETVRRAAKKLRENNREEFNRKMREFRANHKTELSAYDKARYQDKTRRWRSNPETLTKYQRRNNEYAKHKRRTDLNCRLAEVLRGRLWKVIRNRIKTESALVLVGCTIDELIIHLESQFRAGMSWANYGRGFGKWNIDHVLPCSAFDLSDPEQQKKCFHYSNLQPLWSIENSSKNAKLDWKPSLQTTN